jgi:tetratricopeptide (TPR) repeat protein
MESSRSQALVSSDWLNERCVALTGRLVSMTRPEAAQLIRACGGVYSSRVGPNVSLVVIGQAGLPLASSGKLNRNLSRARRLNESGQHIEILSEEEFLDRCGVDAGNDGVHRRFTASQVARLLGIPLPQLRHWTRIGLISAVHRTHSVAYYDFSQVSIAKRLLRLTRSGVRPAQLRKSLRQLAAWMPDMQVPLEQLQLLQDSRRLMVRMQAGQLAEPTGQLNMDFSDQQGDAPAESVHQHLSVHSADNWFDRGCRFEENEQFAEAASAYRQALLAGGPTPELCFNLANVLYQLGKKPEASERYRQAVELEPSFVEAWNNLGTVLAELKQCDEAIAALQRAIELDPQYADSYFNRADCLDENDRREEAIEYWRVYAQLDPNSHWGTYAQEKAATENRSRQDR